MNGISVETQGQNLHIKASAYGGDTRVVYEVGPGPVLAFIANAAVPEPGEGDPVAGRHPEAREEEELGVGRGMIQLRNVTYSGATEVYE